MTRVMIAIREIRSIRRNSIRNVALKKKYMSDDDFLQRRDNTRALSRLGSPWRLLHAPEKILYMQTSTVHPNTIKTLYFRAANRQ